MPSDKLMENMGRAIPYTSFDNYILRSPLFPLNFYISLLEGNQIEDESILKLLDNKIVAESIFLASPELYFQAIKWKSKQLNDQKKIYKLKLSLLKYLARMSTRCTPFGLFAGSCLGRVDNKTNIVIDEQKSFKRFTTFDMNYLVPLAQTIANDHNISPQLKFYPNTSIYKVGNKYRYIEYYSGHT